MKRTTVDDLHKKWLKNPNYRREYTALEEEFSLTRIGSPKMALKHYLLGQMRK